MIDYNTNNKPYFDNNFADLNCDWCLLVGKEEQAYTCVPFGQSGWSSPQNVCRYCLMACINQEIENIRMEIADNYINKEWRIPMEIEVIKSIAFEGLN